MKADTGVTASISSATSFIALMMMAALVVFGGSESHARRATHAEAEVNIGF